ncbi:MAG: hypothetical protein HY965_02885 [Ignavibacteriales bacterium]|nr:hypothetical protein [Ignavibacteriales bacterium]
MKKLYGTIQELSALDKNLLDACVERFGTRAIKYTEINEDQQGLFILLDPEDAVRPLEFLTEEQVQNLQPYTPVIDEGRE